jgi:hypothetical protein
VTDEADRKRTLVAGVNALIGGWARRVEDRWAVGALDLIIKLPRLPILFAEGKIIEGNVFGPTERQWVEGERIKAAGLSVLLLGWKGSTIYVSPWVKQADRRHCDAGINNVIAIINYLKAHP